MKRVIKLIPSDQIRHMPDNENPFVRGDIIIRPEDFGPYWGDNPGDGPDGDFGLGSASDPSREGGFTELFDFGASTVELRPEAAAARDVGKLHAGLADAVGRLDTFTRGLMDDPDFESYPRRLAEETGRIRNEIGGTIPDGDHGELFENAFELMSRNAATRIRGVATERLVIGNRLGLGKSLGTYAALVAGSTDPVTTNFAANRGLEAIDDQVAAGIIDEAEAARLGQGFMVDIDEKSAASLIKDDPAFAVTEFDTAGAFPNLDEARRAELAAHARDRVAAVKRDTELAKARADRAEALEKARAAEAFEADYLSRLDTGAATLAEISDAGVKGAITPERSARLKSAFEQAATRRIEDDRLARVLADARETGIPLDPDNADHKAALESDFERSLKPALIEARTPEEIALIRRIIARDGMAPDGLSRLLGVWWRSEIPALADKAAQLVVPQPDSSSTGKPAVTMPILPGMKEYAELKAFGVPPEQAVAQAKAAETVAPDHSKLDPAQDDRADDAFFTEPDTDEFDFGGMAEAFVPIRDGLAEAGLGDDAPIARLADRITAALRNRDQGELQDAAEQLTLIAGEEFQRLGASLGDMKLASADGLPEAVLKELGVISAIGVLISRLKPVLQFFKRAPKRRPPENEPERPTPQLPPLPRGEKRDEDADKDKQPPGIGHNGPPEASAEPDGKRDVEVSPGITVRTTLKSRFLPRLKGALDKITRKESRQAAEELVNGGELTTVREARGNMSNITRPGGLKESLEAYDRTVETAGGSPEDVSHRQTDAGPMKEYHAEDGTSFIYRTFSSKGKLTVEIQIRKPLEESADADVQTRDGQRRRADVEENIKVRFVEENSQRVPEIDGDDQ